MLTVSGKIRAMDEDKIQASRREHDERSTKERAAILGLQYLDTRDVENTLELAKDILSNDEMYKGRIVTLTAGDEQQTYRFGITTQTPQSLMQSMKKDYNDKGK